MFRLECLNADGHTVASASEVNGALVVRGCMTTWRETCRLLLPIITEAAKPIIFERENFPPLPRR